MFIGVGGIGYKAATQWGCGLQRAGAGAGIWKKSGTVGNRNPFWISPGSGSRIRRIWFWIFGLRDAGSYFREINNRMGTGFTRFWKSGKNDTGERPAVFQDGIRI